MRKFLLLLCMIMISLKSLGGWKFHSSSQRGDTFHLHTNTIANDGVYVYFWYMKSFLIPSKFGDFSSKVKIKGDCANNRLKYLTYIWYKEPLGMGPGERSDKESEWKYPPSESVGKHLLNDVCNSQLSK